MQQVRGYHLGKPLRVDQTQENPSQLSSQTQCLEMDEDSLLGTSSWSTLPGDGTLLMWVKEKPCQDLSSNQDYNVENDLSLLKPWSRAGAGAGRGFIQENDRISPLTAMNLS